jgi:C-terminal processing protease CtpA/Prc
VVQALIRELHRAYVFPDKAEALDRDLNQRQRQHGYDALASRLSLASALTTDMQRLTHDKHLRVELSCSGMTARPGKEPATPGGAASEGPRVIGSTRRLDGNVAYVDVATFNVTPELARDEVGQAMNAAADAAAIIFDVRSNGGGDAETVALVSSYIFGAEPVHLNSLYWRVSGRTDEFFTDPRVKGAKFGPTKPVFVLTSGRTFSAAEEFTYNLQARKRATIVGETTGGGAHPGDLVSLPHGFVAFVPSGRAINPITKTNWEGTGVKPDVAVSSDAALETAHKLALEQVAKAR